MRGDLQINHQIFNELEEKRCVFVLGMDRAIVTTSIEAEYESVVAGLRRANASLGQAFGDEFLAKIAQLTIRLPPPQPAALHRLLSAITGNPEVVDHDEVDPDLAKDFEQTLRAVGAHNPVEISSRSAEMQQARSGDDRATAAIREAERVVRADLLRSDSPDVAAAEKELLQYLDPNPRQVKRFDNAYRLQLWVANRTAGANLNFGRTDLLALGRWVILGLRWPDRASLLYRDRKILIALEKWANTLGKSGKAAPSSDLQEGCPDCLDDPALLELLRTPDGLGPISSIPSDAFLRVW